jgi:hypothetical protein
LVCTKLRQSERIHQEKSFSQPIIFGLALSLLGMGSYTSLISNVQIKVPHVVQIVMEHIHIRTCLEIGIFSMEQLAKINTLDSFQLKDVGV